MNNIKLSTIQELYDLTKDAKNIQYQQYQFQILPQDKDNEQFYNVRLADQQYFIQAQVIREEMDLLDKDCFQNTQMVVRLQKWKLKEKKNGLVLVIHALEYVGECECHDIQQFVPHYSKQEQKQFKETQKQRIKSVYEKVIDSIEDNNPKEPNPITIRGRVMAILELHDRLEFYILPEARSESLEVVVWNNKLDYQIKLFEIYDFENILAYEFREEPQLRINDYSKIKLSHRFDIPFHNINISTIEMTCQNIKEISQKNKNASVNLIAIIKQKNEINQYIVYDQSGSITLINNPMKISPDVKNGDIVVIRNVKVSINDQNEKFLSFGDQTQLIDNLDFSFLNIIPKINELKEWALEQEKNFQQGPINTISQLRNLIINQLNNKEKQFLPLECYGYISKIKYNKEVISDSQFQLNVEIKDATGVLKAFLSNKTAIKLLGMNLYKFCQLDAKKRFQKLEQIKYIYYNIWVEQRVLQGERRRRRVITNIEKIGNNEKADQQ